jgi:hypothetical protein
VKVGDLVSLKMKETVPPQEPQVGVVVEIGTPVQIREWMVKVHWQKHGGISPWIDFEKFEVV